MATQRFIAGTSVFDTYAGCSGEITEMNLNTMATPSLAPMFVGAYFVVKLNDGFATPQVFTTAGKRVDHSSGNILSGVTLLTSSEYTALLGAGYPK